MRAAKASGAPLRYYGSETAEADEKRGAVEDTEGRVAAQDFSGEEACGLGADRAVCPICPHACALVEGQTGLCRARVAEGGEVVDANYGRITSLALDPIEKKPLARFRPGSKVLSVGSYGCNLRCPFCQNGNLVQHPEWEPVIPEEEIFAVLEKRRGVLDGVCVTGGEPTLDPDLERFVTKIKELGYLVKLDTNGYRPEILKKLVEEKKIDYVAMDIKNAPSRYGETAGVKKIDVMRINESVEFLKSGVVDYEFRTTLCKELHGREEIEAIGKWLSGAKRYFLQNYRESDYVIDPRFSGYAREQLEQFCEILRGKIETVEIRGVD